MKDLIIIIIGVFCLGLLISQDIKAYEFGIYNPYSFRMRTDYEEKTKYLFGNFGYLMPMFIITNMDFRYIYIAFGFLVHYFNRTLLNYKCFKLKGDRRILIETLITNIICIGIIVLLINDF